MSELFLTVMVKLNYLPIYFGLLGSTLAKIDCKSTRLIELERGRSAESMINSQRFSVITIILAISSKTVTLRSRRVNGTPLPIWS